MMKPTNASHRIEPKIPMAKPIGLNAYAYGQDGPIDHSDIDGLGFWDDAVDVADNVAIAEIQFGLVQVAARLKELGLGLFDGRRIGNDVGVNAVEVALGILFVEVGDGLFRRGGAGATRTE